MKTNSKSNKNLTPFAKQLRRSMTGEEKKLWYDFLKKLPVTVNRQKVVGKYIADFYIASASLVVEIDGSQHREEDAAVYDAERDAYMNSLGIGVVRYSNKDINDNFSSVCRDLLSRLGLTFDDL